MDRNGGDADETHQEASHAEGSGGNKAGPGAGHVESSGSNAGKTNQEAGHAEGSGGNRTGLEAGREASSGDDLILTAKRSNHRPGKWPTKARWFRPSWVGWRWSGRG